MKITDAVNWVTANRTLPAVANMSLTLGAPSSMLNQAIANSVNTGVVYTIAAGNCPGDGFGGCTEPPKSACINSPANSPSGITVAATNIRDSLTYFSYFGNCVAIDAPGENITSDWVGSTTATNDDSGTSMAAPHVGGAAVLFLQANPSATPAQVKSAILNRATFGVVGSLPSGTPNLLLFTGSLNQPTLTATITGPSLIADGRWCTWTANATGGVPPYTYSWYMQDPAHSYFSPSFGSGQTFQSEGFNYSGPFYLTVTVTSADGLQGTTVAKNGTVNSFGGSYDHTYCQ